LRVKFLPSVRAFFLITQTATVYCVIEKKVGNSTYKGSTFKQSSAKAMTVGITGGTGFVGSHLSRILNDAGHTVVVFTRNIEGRTNTDRKRFARWDAESSTCDSLALSELDAMVHLAGAGVADQRLTAKRKQEIVYSRVAATKFLADQMLQHAQRCKTIVAASAIGFYGADKGGAPFTEDALADSGFLGETSRNWEVASAVLEPRLRRVVLRIGIVLGNESGAFPEFKRPVALHTLPSFGTGEQVVSWISVEDLANMMVFSIINEQVKGTYNAVAPQPVSQVQLMKSIAHAMGGWHIPFSIPSFALKLLLGEMSVEILKSTTVSAQKIIAAGFNFQYPTIDFCVKHLVRK
jgi:uncharacterized protein